jgi:ATP-dependent Clp protease ATP-binding subunit ClpC
LTLASAEDVAQRMVGMPLSPAQRLAALRERLTERALLPAAEAERLLKRLEVTLRGLDIRSGGPNAVVLLMGNAAAVGESLAEVIAEALFGGADRVVTLHLGRLTQPFDVSALIGAPPGYIGYSDTLPLHALIQMPWCVLRCEDVDACHHEVREILTRGIADGVITDALGKHIYLSDAVILLTCSVKTESKPPVGFVTDEDDGGEDLPTRAARDAAVEAFGRDLLERVDVVCADVPTADEAGRKWIEGHLLAGLSERYRRHGIDLQWDESLINWLLDHKAEQASQREWERLADERISPLLVPYLDPPDDRKEAQALVLKSVDGEVHVEPCPPSEPQEERE